MTIRIQPYKSFSGGAKAIGLKAGILRATQKQVEKHGDFDHIINWGSSERRFRGEYLNNPEAVAVASDKLLSAQAFAAAEVPQPEFTDNRETAQEWLDAGFSVVCRTLLRASAGRGIRLVVPRDYDAAGGVARDLQDDGEAPRVVAAPLYTKYAKKADEYRVHVFLGTVLDIQMKRKRQEVNNDEVNYQIRNLEGGWVFCRDGVECPESVQRAAIAAVNALDLDFGAVDIGFNRHAGQPYVFEVNTAPGVEGTTLDRYYDALVGRYPVLAGGAYQRRRNAA